MRKHMNICSHKEEKKQLLNVFGVLIKWYCNNHQLSNPIPSFPFLPFLRHLYSGPFWILVFFGLS